ncbi:LysM peptidoglycan-binding domain-containing protein [Filifactor villosus]|uniref:LysM peptidoglycan-binding domain-containing protein n=1 Tax=Filifactor villosus TaxID=29374 RepID=A0ABV9QKT2_9FIRM
MTKYETNPKIRVRNYRRKREDLKNRRRIYIARIILITVVCSLLSMSIVYAFSNTHNSSADSREPIEFLVQHGDTLWNISLNYKPEGMDTREYIRQIMYANSMKDSLIKVGETIYLPR